MIDIEQAIERGKSGGAMLYNRKSNCPDDKRDQELRNLYELAVLAPDGPSVEIGTYKGGSIICWAVAREGRGPIWAVDNNTSKVNAICRAQLTRYGIQATFLEMNSLDAALLMPSDFAFVFVDGNHAYGILDDVGIWSKKVRPLGIIIYHDYGTRKCPNVKIAVGAWERAAHWEFIGQVGSSRAYRRPAEM